MVSRKLCDSLKILLIRAPWWAKQPFQSVVLLMPLVFLSELLGGYLTLLFWAMLFGLVLPFLSSVNIKRADFLLLFSHLHSLLCDGHDMLA